MGVRRMDHVGIVVDDLEAAIAFFAALGLETQGEWAAEGGWVDRIVGLEGVQADNAMMRTPDGQGKVELVRFRSPTSQGAGGDPEPANVPGIRHLTFLVDDLDATIAALRPHGGELIGEVEQYRDMFRLCYVRGPAGIIVELAEEVD